MVLIKELNKSASSPNKPPYETLLSDDGKLSCNCRGWATKKLNQARECTHTKELVRKHRLTPYVIGDYTYATGSANGHLLPPPPSLASQGWPKPKTWESVVSEADERVPTKYVSPKAEPVRRFKTVGSDTHDETDYVKPMLAQVEDDSRTCEQWLAHIQTYSAYDWMMEEKFDGFRVMFIVKDGTVRAWSRPRAGKDALVRELPEHILAELVHLPNGSYDGELIVPGGTSSDVTDSDSAGTERLMVFDVTRLLGADTTKMTYDKRRELLVAIFEEGTCPSEHVQLSSACAPSADILRAIWARNGEGAMLKRRQACYQPGARSADLIKVKTLEHAVMIVTGFEKGKNGPYSKVVLLNPKDNSVTTVKTKNVAQLKMFEAGHEKFIGRKLMIEYQFRTAPSKKHPAGGYRHPRWDRWENE